MSENKITRREKIIKVASKLFFEKGFSNTSIDDIIKLTGGSKRDIYNEFKNKSGLLSEIIKIYTDRVSHEVQLEKFDENNVELSLKKFGYGLAQSYTKPEIIGLYTMIYKEAKKFPDLALEFYEKGPMLGTLKLAEFLQKCMDKGELKNLPNHKLASFFISMLREKIHSGVFLNNFEPACLDDIEKDVDLVVEIFLTGIKA